MSAVSNNLLIAGDDGYTINRSVRLRSSASAYFNRTPASAGNRKTWTWSGWVKRGTLATRQQLFSAYNPANSLYIEFVNSTDTLRIIEGGGGTNLTTTQVFRDSSAWYHIVVAWDTTQATASNRVKIYLNGSQITSFGTSTYPTLNLDGDINNTILHNVGCYASGAFFFDGYLTEVNFIDGQALTPDSFGEYDSITGVWKPAKYTGTYGTNGFYLDFSDNTTTTTLAEDKSGNGNNWTANNISLTSGATYDSMTDTPTPYADGGNYAVLNPLDKSTQATISDGNLKIRVAVTGANHFAKSTMTLPADKIYFEATAGNNTGGTLIAELGLVDVTTQTFAGVKNGVQCVNGDLLKIVNGSYTSLGGGGVTSGTVIGLAYDLISGLMTIYRNGTAVASNQSIPTTYTSVLAHAYRDVANDVGWELNFGQRPFAYTPPTGFKALHTGNLPEPDIVDGGEHFNAVLWTGDSTNNRSITGVGFQPDFTWVKDRSAANHHVLNDVIRGGGNWLMSNLTNAERSDYGSVQTFDSDGFTLGYTSGDNSNVNNSGNAYVGWSWKANGAGASNTDGSITSTVSANPTAGFSIVTYTGNGTAGATVGHGLGVAPAMIIIKNRTTTPDWLVFHRNANASPQNGGMFLNRTDAFVSDSNYFNNTSPISTRFTIGSNDRVNTNGNNYVAYCFAEVEGYSKFGSYTGNGSADGPFVFCGFRPAFVMIKRTDTTADWVLLDTSRDPYNYVDNALYPNASYAENVAGSAYLDILSNGFKLRIAGGTTLNTSGGTYIYMAFAEVPAKYSLAR